MRLLPCGDTGLLVELPGLREVLALRAALAQAPPPGLVDLVPAARTLLLVLVPGTQQAAERAVRSAAAVADEEPDGPPAADGPLVQVPVVYDGPDLDEVGGLTGLGRRGVVEAHTGADWTVGFVGFAPGFGYLTGGDPRLAVPRRPAPRRRVPAGAVGLAGEFSGVYPRESPGGWQLLGRAALQVWDLDRDPPALLQPGVRVRFVAVGGTA